jgi:anhydro-N-acetylmuramic acid kinase
MSALFIGLMSGTSMDGIDAALVDLSAMPPRLVATHAHPYPEILRTRLLEAIRLKDPLGEDLSRLDDDVGVVFAEAANTLLESSGTSASAVTAIGSHGQTIHHAPDAARPYSLQIGNPRHIAGLTGINVVADFRRADIEAGGQGAPLVPAFHAALFRCPTETRVVVNIGGIANITVLPADPSEPVTGFDTGPGNTLMDQWVWQQRDLSLDRDGEWAAGGHIDPELLACLQADPYFQQVPPKSTGREHFNLDWLSACLGQAGATAQDVQSTLCELTAVSIADAVRQFAGETRRLLVCGGGVHNKELLRRLAAAMDSLAVESTRAHGLDPDWVEAAAFAWLAQQHLEGKPGNIPEVTGADHPVVLGRLFKRGY